MEDLEKSRKDRKLGLILGTILMLVLISLMWIFGDEDNKRKTIIYSIIFVIGIIGGWLFYFRQVKEDKSPQMKKSAGGKIVKSMHVFGGINQRILSIIFIIIAIGSLIVGGYILVDGFTTGNEYWWIGGVVVGLGVLFIFLARNFWKLSRPRMKGRDY
jgi:Na+/melibiose symporter-like transporter